MAPPRPRPHGGGDGEDEPPSAPRARALGGGESVAAQQDAVATWLPEGRVAPGLHSRMVQPARRAVPPAGVRAALSDAGIRIVYGGIEIAHDDDPGWVLSDYVGEQDLGVAFFQADVLPEYRDSWAFLRDRAPGYDEEFQIADLDDLAAEHPLVVGLDFAPDNVREILGALPHIRGLMLTLGDRVRRGGVRYHSYRDALNALRG